MTALEHAVAEAHQREWATLLARLVRLTRDLDLAEDIAQEAFATALEVWRRNGVPRSPAAWLWTTARHRALDALRREQALARKLPLLIVPDADDGAERDEGAAMDERLRLIFTCCHPALSLEARVALTLRLVCGLETRDIARLFLVTEATMAARLTRAKHKIRTAGIPYRAPADHELTDRLPAVLGVVLLLFTEGHAASHGQHLQRPELTRQAIELARFLEHLMPDEPEVVGLHALLLLTEARRPARVDVAGHLVLLEDQDRRVWDGDGIAHGVRLAERALRLSSVRGPGRYAIEAAIAAVHAEAPSFEATDWAQIVALYDALLLVHPSPVAALGRAVAVGMAYGAAEGLMEVERLAGDPRLARFHLLEATRAELLRRLGRADDAAAAFRAAAAGAGNEVERESLLERATAVSDS